MLVCSCCFINVIILTLLCICVRIYIHINAWNGDLVKSDNEGIKYTILGMH